MSTQKEENRDVFAEAKSIFDQLGLGQKAEFLATETLNTAIEAVNTLVDYVSEECCEVCCAPASSADEKDSAGAEAT